MQPRGRRIPADRQIDLIEGSVTVPTTLLDVSSSGLRVKMKAGDQIVPGGQIVVSNGLRSVPGKVMWRRGAEAGIHFTDKVSPKDMHILTGVAPPASGGGWSSY